MPRTISIRAIPGVHQWSLYDWLVVIFVVTLFVPEQIVLTVGPLDLRPIQGAALLLLGVFIFGGVIRFRWPDGLMLAIFIQRFLSLLLSGSVGRAVENTGRQMLELCAAYLLGRFLALDRQRFWSIIRIFLVILLFMSAFGLYESITFSNLHHIIWHIPFNRGSGENVYRMGMLRAMGWTTHPIIYGMSYVVGLIFICTALKFQFKSLGRFALLKIIGVFLGLFCCLSSGPWLGAIILFSILFLEHLTRKLSEKKWIYLIVILLVVYAFLEAASNRPILSYFMMLLHISSPDSAYYRYALYGRVFDAMPGHWWWGHGVNASSAFVPVFGNSSCDNHYLVLLLEYGILGVGLWISFMLSALLYRCRDTMRNYYPLNMNEVQVLRFGIVALAIVQTSVDLFSTATPLCWVLLGMSISASHMGVPQMRRNRSGFKNACHGKKYSRIRKTGVISRGEYDCV